MTVDFTTNALIGPGLHQYIHLGPVNADTRVGFKFNCSFLFFWTPRIC